MRLHCCTLRTFSFVYAETTHLFSHFPSAHTSTILGRYLARLTTFGLADTVAVVVEDVVAADGV
jgi:hypothetical protein